MRYAGIAWTATGYSVSIIDSTDVWHSVSLRFGADAATAIVDHLSTLAAQDERGLTAVIESGNGMLDGSLMAAGLTVYRADPQRLPAPGPGLGAPDSMALACAARYGLSGLTRLAIETGTLTGRLEEVDEAIQRSMSAEGELTAAGHCLRHGDPSSQSVALTFDDGPHPAHTPLVLDVLKRFGVPATFFCVGLHATGHPGLVDRIRDEGHQVGNHTWSHAYLPDLSQKQLAAQVERTAEQLSRYAAPETMPFRPPYGSRTPEVLGWLRDLDQSVVLWDVEPFDWALPGAQVIADRVLADTQGGSIILMHDGGGDRSQTVAALPRILEGLLERGFEFSTMETLPRTVPAL